MEGAFEQERFSIDEETGNWLAEDRTWDLVTSGKTETEARRFLAMVREKHIAHVRVQ